ncbi:MAG: hypothetical protein ACTHMK_01765 [Dyella sp.]|uniref:hypothetical protein n=1 Tax=Dyella sp. TaxID=1869338 RepID=UPI003F7D1A65
MRKRTTFLVVTLILLFRFAGSTIRGDQQQGDGTAALPFDRAAAGKAKNRRVELVEQ